MTKPLCPTDLAALATIRSVLRRRGAGERRRGAGRPRDAFDDTRVAIVGFADSERDRILSMRRIDSFLLGLFEPA